MFQKENFSIFLTVCKSYSEKNAKEYKINDALRVKQARLLLKSNKDIYEEQKRKERERKLLAKDRKKFAINHPHLDQEPSQTSFSNYAVKEGIKSLAPKFYVKVKLGQKVGRKKNVLSEQEKKWLIEFFNQPDVSYTSPGRRDNVIKREIP